MKLDKQDIEYKEYLAWEKRRDKLYKILQTMPYKKLDKPFQKGWVVTQHLREDVAKRKDASLLNKLIQVGFYPFKKIIKEKEVKIIRSGKKSYTYTNNKQKYHVDLSPDRKTLSEKEYKELPETLQKHFWLDRFSDAYRLWNRKYYNIEYFPEYYTVLKARPNMITHYRDKGGELEQEYEYLQDKIRQYWIEHGDHYWGSHPKHNGRAKTRDTIRKFINGEIDDIYNEKIDKDYDY